MEEILKRINKTISELERVIKEDKLGLNGDLVCRSKLETWETAKTMFLVYYEQQKAFKDNFVNQLENIEEARQSETFGMQYTEQQQMFMLGQKDILETVIKIF